MARVMRPVTWTARHAVRVRQHYFFAFRDPWHDAASFGLLPAVWLRHPSLVAKPAAGMPIPKSSNRFVNLPQLARHKTILCRL
jgi:hypothetical protein